MATLMRPLAPLATRKSGFENNGKGTFTNHLVARDQEAYDIRATDLDRDGDIDLLIAGRGSKNVTWYANPAK